MNNFSRPQGQSAAESLIEEDQSQEVLEMVNEGHDYKSIREAHPEAHFVHFKDIVCDVRDFLHPGGQSILTQVLGRDVTKYIFGGAALEGNLTVPHQHTSYAVAFLEGRKIGSKNNLVKGLSHSSWRVQETYQMSREFFRFELENDTLQLETLPRSCKDYLGKYWLVTAGGKTRPYTLILCHDKSRRLFRDKLLQSSKNGFKEALPTEKSETTTRICLMIKRYEQGSVSRAIHENL